MHTADSLLDLHARTHCSLARLFRHCRKLSAEELHRELPGFGMGSVHGQLFHVVDCEDWWIGGAGSLSIADNRGAEYPDVPTLESFRRRIAEQSAGYLRGCTPAELNTPRVIRIGGKRGPTLAPAHVVLHALTHAFHHKGQTVAMCRLLGYPAPDTDLPVRPQGAG
jgi:uncharacterized damage-inducible protein DinB